MKSKRLQKVVDRFLNPTETPEVTEELNEDKTDTETTSRPKKGKRKVKDLVDNVEDGALGENVDKAVEKVVNNSGNSVKRGRGRGRGRGQSKRGRGQKGHVSRSVKRSKASVKLSGSSSSSSSSEESDSDFLYESNDEVPIVESGLNIAEILGMSGFSDMGTDSNPIENMDVDEEVQRQETVEQCEEVENAAESDESVSDSELFKNEGGFIREEKEGSVQPIKPSEPQRTEIMHDIMKQLEKAKSKYFETETSQEEISAVDTQSKYFQDGNALDREAADKTNTSKINTKANNEITDSGRDNVSDKTISKNEEIQHSESASDTKDNAQDNSNIDMEMNETEKDKHEPSAAKSSLSSLPRRKVDYNKKVERILRETKTARHKECGPNIELKNEMETSKEDKILSKKTSATSAESFKEDQEMAIEATDVAENDILKKKTATVDESGIVKIEIGDADRDKTVINDKRAKVKKEIGDTYTNDPIKQLVTGVPWAGKKGKTKGVGKGKTRLKGRKTEPVEKIVRKSTRSAKGSKSSVGVINLSESDTDSSD